METINMAQFESLSAITPADNVSGKYTFIPTTHVINQFSKSGWLPVKANEVKVRKQEYRGAQKHMVRFRHESMDAVNGLFPEIILVNSHNRTSCFEIMAGLFRVACLNGLILADSQMEPIKIRHQGYTDTAVNEAIEFIGDHIPQVYDKVNMYQNISLSHEERGVYAESALAIKYGENTKEYRIRHLLTPKRPAENDPTLWNTFNIIQEKFQRGGSAFLTNKAGKPHKNRGIKSVSEDIRVNRGLWHLTQRMAELKG